MRSKACWGVAATRAPAVTPQILTYAAQPNPAYDGGPLLEGPQVYAIFWRNTVEAATVSGIPGFFDAVLGSSYLDMLAEYNTTAPAHTIGHGTLQKAYTDEGAPAPNPDAGNTITDVQIRAELSRLFDLGELPEPTASSVYFIYFGPDAVIDQGSGTLSCTNFCAYHGNFTRNGNNVFYSVHPSLGPDSNCANVCGDPDPMNRLYGYTSHELADALTDPAYCTGPNGWIDTGRDANGTQWGEIAEPCTFQPAGSVGGFVVQPVWSNAANGCRTTAAATSDVMAVAPGEGTLIAGGAALVFTVTNQGNAGPLTLGYDPGGLITNNVTITVTPSSIAPGQSATVSLTASASARSLDTGFQVDGTDNSNGVTHLASPLVHVVGGAHPAITGLAPAAGPSNGGTDVTLSGTGLSEGTRVLVDNIAVAGTFDLVTKTVRFKTPSHAIGNATVTATNVNDAATTATAPVPFVFTAGPAPTVVGVAPNGGPTDGGQVLMLSGSNFSSNMTVVVGGVTVAASSWQLASSSGILVTTPKHAAGVVDIMVTNGDGQAATLSGRYRYGAPAVTALSAASGPTGGGFYVSILGDNFGATPTVTFGGTAATVKSVGTSFLGVVTPPHQPETVDVVVTNPGGTMATLPASFTFLGPPLDMSGSPDMTPPSGGGDDMAGDMAAGSCPAIWWCRPTWGRPRAAAGAAAASPVAGRRSCRRRRCCWCWRGWRCAGVAVVEPRSGRRRSRGYDWASAKPRLRLGVDEAPVGPLGLGVGEAAAPARDEALTAPRLDHAARRRPHAVDATAVVPLPRV
jgi:hypothetical protein